MNKKAFTLMELLLVIAILAIVAAAGMPFFSSGSNQALKEAKKSNFLSAYQNTISGANLFMSLLLTNYTSSVQGADKTMKPGFLPEGLSLDAKNQWKIGNQIKNLANYSPLAGRVFYDLKGKPYFFSAKFGPNQTLVVYYVDPGTNQYSDQAATLENYHGSAYTQKDNKGQELDFSNGRDLDYYWNKINEGLE